MQIPNLEDSIRIPSFEGHMREVVNAEDKTAFYMSTGK